MAQAMWDIPYVLTFLCTAVCLACKTIYSLYIYICTLLSESVFRKVVVQSATAEPADEHYNDKI